VTRAHSGEPPLSSGAEPAAMDDKIHDEPSEVTAEDGTVMVDGPDGVAVALTPEAASETSERLLFGAAKAQGQKIAERERKKPRL